MANFQEVKDKVPVAAFFESILHLKAHPMSTGIRFPGCPSCGESKDPNSVRVNVRGNKWKCFSCDAGGDVIDAAAAFYEVGHPEAANMLMNSFGIPEAIKNWKAKAKEPLRKERIIDPATTRKVIEHLLNAGKNLPMDKKVFAYLISRGISEEAILAARSQGMIVTLPSTPADAKEYLAKVVGRDLLEEAGMWHPGAKAPGASYRPLGFVTTGAKSIEFRLIRKPVNEKEVKLISYGPMNPFFFAGSAADEFVVTEGMTDLLSVLSFGSKKSVIGLPGCNRFVPRWFSRMAGKDVMLALDADGPGQKAMHKPGGLVETLQESHARVSIFSFPEKFLAATPEKDRDINGYLNWRKSGMH